MPPRQAPTSPSNIVSPSSASAAATTAGQTTTAQTNAGTTKSKSTKSMSSTTNIELEFTQRFLSLFTSFYETPSIEEILTFPQTKPAPPTEVKAPTRMPPFHSGVWDLRLKKAIDARITNDQLTSDSLSEQVLQLRETLASDNPGMSDIFVPQKTERPQIPLYIQNIQKEEALAEEERTKRTKPQSSNVAELTQLFTERLRTQKAMSKERAKRRFMRAKELEKEHMEFVRTLHKTKVQETMDTKTLAKSKFKVLQELREKQLQQGKSAVESMRSKSPAKTAQVDPVIVL